MTYVKMCTVCMTYVKMCTVCMTYVKMCTVCMTSPRGLTFTWWGYSGLCPWHKPTELAHSFHSVLVSVSLLWPFHLCFIRWILPTALRILTLYSQSCFCLVGPFSYISLSKSLPNWFQRPGAFAVRCDPCRGKKGSWRLRYPLAAACWGQHISLARTSLRRVVGLARPNQSAGRV